MLPLLPGGKKGERMRGDDKGWAANSEVHGFAYHPARWATFSPLGEEGDLGQAHEIHGHLRAAG